MQFTDGFSYSNLWFPYELPKYRLNRFFIGTTPFWCIFVDGDRMVVRKGNAVRHLILVASHTAMPIGIAKWLEKVSPQRNHPAVR